MKKLTFHRVMNAIQDDVAYNRGGWMFFLGRMAMNAVVIFYLMNFVKSFILFAFISQEIIMTEQMTELIAIIIWASGVLYLAFRIPVWTLRDDED